MELATDTRAVSAYSPTSTPILDGLRPPGKAEPGKLSAGEYFFFSSVLILTLVWLPELRAMLLALRLPAVSVPTVILAGPAAALLIAMLVHELGHLVAGELAGFRLVRVALPVAFTGRRPANRRLDAGDCLRVGALIVAPRRSDHMRRRLFTLFLGGPAAAVLFATALEACPHWATMARSISFGIHVVSAFCILTSVAALLPDVTRHGNFSDGARALMLLKNDARAMRWMAILQMQLALESGIHPRDWDPTLVVRATLINDDTRDAVAAHWLGYLWAAERQDITSATRYLEDALAAPASISNWLRDRLFLEAAVFQAWFRDNPAKAQAWAALIRGKKLTALQQQRLTIVLLWAEGKLFDAWEKMAAYVAALRQLPAAPARDMAEKSALEWKHQMESRMLTRAWRTIYSMSREVDHSTNGNAVASPAGPQVSSW